MSRLDAPDRAAVLQTMRATLRGEITREAAAEWAGRWVHADNPRVSDDLVWRGLIDLVGIDLRTAPTTYLHSDRDIEVWIEAFESHE